MLKKTNPGKETAAKNKLIPTLLTIIIVLLSANLTISVLTYVNNLNTKPVIIENQSRTIQAVSGGVGITNSGVIGGDANETVSEEPAEPETPIRDVTVDEKDFTGNEQQGDE